jgi:hypothetical protein
MIKCPNCHELIDESANFCHLCGERIVVEPPPPKPVAVYDPTPNIPRWLPWALAVIAAVVVGAIGWSLVSSDGTQPAAQPTAPAQASGSPSPNSPSTSVPAPQQVLAATGTTLLRVTIGSCEGCVISPLLADGRQLPPGTVSEGAVEFLLPTAETLGLAFAVAHPQGFGGVSGPNIAVLAADGADVGSPVPVAAIADAATAGVCWAGTIENGARISLAVEPFADKTPTGGLRVWADPAQPVLKAPIAPTADGTVEAGEAQVCGVAVATLAG